MIESGFVMLVQSGLSGLVPAVPGGYAVQLPKDLITPETPMAWTYRSIVSEPSYTLGNQDGFTSWEVQVDCHGYAMSNAITLARAIDGVLRGGYSGTLADSDHTIVYGIFRLGSFIDGFSSVSRTYVRTIEYKIQYSQI